MHYISDPIDHLTLDELRALRLRLMEKAAPLERLALGEVHASVARWIDEGRLACEPAYPGEYTTDTRQNRLDDIIPKASRDLWAEAEKIRGLIVTIEAEIGHRTDYKDDAF
mgnify:CR=1 FL=1